MTKAVTPASSTATITIRPAVRKDIAALVEFAARSFYDAFAPTNTPANMDAYMSQAFTVEQFTWEFEDPRATFYLAEKAKQIVGYAKLYRGERPDCVLDANAIELSRLYVDANQLGAGVGPALLQQCLATARREQFTTMFLGVWEYNPRAHAFYRKWGFKRVGEHLFQMGDDPQIDWWMAQSL